MKIVIATIISFFCQAGTLTHYENNFQYKLECPDKKFSYCFFDLELPIGGYMYLSEDKKDTSILIVGNSLRDTYIYKTTGKFILNQ